MQSFLRVEPDNELGHTLVIRLALRDRVTFANANVSNGRAAVSQTAGVPYLRVPSSYRQKGRENLGDTN